MKQKMTLPAIALIVFAGVAAASAGFAQTSSPTVPAPQGQGMMSGTGDMSNMMNMMGQMTKMMENCNQMMKSASDKATAPGDR